MTDGPGIKVPVDLALLVNAEAHTKKLRDDLREARKDGEKIKRNQVASGHSANVPAGARERIQTATAALNDFKTQVRSQRDEQQRINALYNLDRYMEGRKASARGAAWDFAVDAGNRKRDRQQQMRSDDWEAAKFSGDRVLELREFIASNRAKILQRDSFRARAQRTATSARTARTTGGMSTGDRMWIAGQQIRQGAAAIGGAAHAFHDTEMNHFGDNATLEQLSRRNNRERVGGQFGAVGSAISAVPGGQVLGGALEAFGGLVGFWGNYDRQRATNTENERLQRQSFQNGRIRMPGERGYSGLDSGALSSIQGRAREDVKRSDAFASAAMTVGLDKLFPSIEVKIMSRVDELAGIAVHKRQLALTAMEQGDFGMAQSYMAQSRQAAGKKPRYWSATQEYMGMVGALDSNRIWMRNQMKRAGPRTGD